MADIQMMEEVFYRKENLQVGAMVVGRDRCRNDRHKRVRIHDARMKGVRKGREKPVLDPFCRTCQNHRSNLQCKRKSIKTYFGVARRSPAMDPN